jgi:hypothetical protein
VIKKEALKEGIQGALTDRGMSSENAASLARSASDTFMKIASNATDFTGIGDMAIEQRADRPNSRKFLSYGLSNIFSKMGMPEVYAKELGTKIASDVYSAKENFANVASLQKAIRISLQRTMYDETFPVDIEKYLGKNGIDSAVESLTMVPPLRKEIVEESVKQAMLAQGIVEYEVMAARCADVIMQTPNVNGSDDEQLRSEISTRLQSVTSEENAEQIANALSLEILRESTAALDNPFNNVLLERDSLVEALTHRGTSLMKGLGNERAGEINTRMAAALFGSPKLEGASEAVQNRSFSELYQQQMDTLMEGIQNDELKNAMLDSVVSNLQKFASPSMEMYDVLQRLMDPSNLMVKSMVRTLQEAREQEDGISISLRQGA